VAGSDHSDSNEIALTPTASDEGVRKGEDVHARVAVYRIISGNAEEIARTADAEGGMLGIFRAHPGFQSYELVGAGETIISISRWDSAEAADAASVLARSWVAEHLARAVELQHHHVGEVVLSSSAPDVVAL
jgi:heme-degrading monooxygenase HmoA